jgi:DNA/RNA endonuclease G (NUC1)
LDRPRRRPGDSNAARRDTTFVCHPRYLLSHDNVNKTPDWVLEHFTSADLVKKFGRPKGKSFSTEKRVPPHGRATNADYTRPKAPLARGHMAPSEDFSKTKAGLNDSFFFSNVVPQIGTKFNGAIGGTLEDQVRLAGKARGEIYVITGPVQGDANTRSKTIPKSQNLCGHDIKLEGPAQEAFICAASNRKPNVFCSKDVSVPIGVFKIVYDPKKGDAYAFLMPNKEYETGQDLDTARDTLTPYRVTVAVIERATG